jgi:hypothetical protein
MAVEKFEGDHKLIVGEALNFLWRHCREECAMRQASQHCQDDSVFVILSPLYTGLSFVFELCSEQSLREQPLNLLQSLGLRSLTRHQIEHVP